MDYTSYIIDKIIRLGIQNKNDKSLNVMLTQVGNPSVNATMESTQIVDALEVPIAELGRAKGLEIGGENALFDFGLLAAQFGSEIEESSASKQFTVHSFMDELVVAGTDEAPTATTSHLPIGEAAAGIPFLYVLNNDGSMKTKIPYGTTASGTAFTFAANTGDSNATVTLNSAYAGVGSKIIVVYDYLASDAVKVARVVDRADEFVKSGILTMEVLFRNVCDKETKYHGYVYCGNAQLDGNFDVNLTPDGKHPFTIRAMKDYCAADQALCTFFIPQGE